MCLNLYRCLVDFCSEFVDREELLPGSMRVLFVKIHEMIRYIAQPSLVK